MTATQIEQRSRHMRWLLLRRSWLVVTGAVMAAVIGNGLVAEGEDRFVARQAMGVRNVVWNEIAVSHERNQGWIAQATPDQLSQLAEPGTSVEVELPTNSQHANFNIMAWAPTAESASELAHAAAIGLVESQGGYTLPSDPLRGALVDERAQAVADVERLDAEVQAMFEERDRRAEAGARAAELDGLRLDAQILDRERQIRSERVVHIDVQLANLDNQSLALLDTIEILRDPVVTDGSTARPLAVAGLVAFVAATLLALLVLAFDRTLAALTVPGQLALPDPDTPVVPLGLRWSTGRGRGRRSWSAGYSALSRRIEDAVADVGPGAGASVALVGIVDPSTLPAVGAGLRSRINAALPPSVVPAPPRDLEQAVEAAALAGRAVVVFGRREVRVGAANRLLRLLDQLDVDVVAVAIAGAVPVGSGPDPGSFDDNAGDSPHRASGSGGVPESASAGGRS